MSETKSNSVLGRIAAAGREDHQARAMNLQKAMRVSLVKAANSLMDLPLAVIGSVVQKVGSDALESLLSDEALLLLLDGPTPLGGAVLIDPVLVGGLIQQQTIGTVRADTGAARQMTRTDAAICAPLLDAVFERVPTIVDSADDARLVEGFRFGAKAEHGRALLMTLDADEYTVLRLTIDLARGTRQGEMVVILPIQNQLVAMAEGPEEQAEQSPKSPEMSKVVMDLTAELDIVLCRLSLPLTQVQGLKLGDVLAIPPGQFPNVHICEKSGRVLGQGTVGHVNGLRAVKPKRKPLHATQPLRRASDEEHVEMPAVEDISEPRERRSAPGVEADTQQRLEDTSSGSEMAVIEQLTSDDEARAEAEKVPVADPVPEEELAALEDFPDLEDLPDLADMPELADMSEAKLPIAS